MLRTALKKFGATTNRPEFQKCLKKLTTGDSLIVWKLDRLGRSLYDLIIVLDGFKERGIKFRSLTENIDTESPTGRAMWQMIGILAELERSQIKERTQAWHRCGQGEGRAIWAQEETQALSGPANPQTYPVRGSAFGRCGKL